jgi:predicted dehydrogenase
VLVSAAGERLHARLLSFLARLCYRLLVLLERGSPRNRPVQARHKLQLLGAFVHTPSRRQFIRRATAALFAAPFISTTVTRALARESRPKLGWALCGLGSLSENQIAPALQKTQFSRLAGIVTGSPEKAQRWRERYDLPKRNVYTYDTIAKMADNPDIDVVYIVTPNALHAEQTIASAKAGKHVFCEKPMAVSVDEGQRMIEACKAAGRKLGVGYRCQFEPHHLECIRLAREKELGDLRVIEANFGFPLGNPNQWRIKKALSGGGALMDVGIYALQAIRYISGEEPVLINAVETKTDPVKFVDVDESMAWQAKFPSGVLGNCSTSFNSAGMGRIRAHAQRGWFGLEPAFNYGGIRGTRSDGKPLEFPAPDQFATEMDDFSQCILENRSSKVAGEEGLRDVKLMMAIYESARAGRAVKV